MSGSFQLTPTQLFFHPPCIINNHPLSGCPLSCNRSSLRFWWEWYKTSNYSCPLPRSFFPNTLNPLQILFLDPKIRLHFLFTKYQFYHCPYCFWSRWEQYKKHHFHHFHLPLTQQIFFRPTLISPYPLNRCPQCHHPSPISSWLMRK